MTSLPRERVESLVRDALRARLVGGAPTAASKPQDVPGKPHQVASTHNGPNPLVVNVSARHVHVSQPDLEVLFGPGATLTKLKDLYQDGEFASEQTVTLIGPRNRMIPNLRILGPTRSYTQVELSYTDGIYLGIDLPVRTSGEHHDTPPGVLVGPHGALNLSGGILRAERHVHMSPADAQHFGVADGQYIKLDIQGPCGLTFDRVRVRVHPKVKLEVHIDTDAGNACHLPTATGMSLIV